MIEKVPPIQMIRAGRVSYTDGLDLQSELEQQRLDDAIPDTVVILEHDPVITIGHRGDVQNVVASQSLLNDLGIEVRRVSRGGDVTYHGPGQVVMYPIVDLHRARMSAAKFVELLEECMISAAGDHGVAATRVPKKRGVFVGSDKIGAVGIHISHGVTTHGLALNVDPDLSHYDLIISCGLREHGITSLVGTLEDSVDQAAVEQSLLSHFARLLGREAREV